MKNIREKLAIIWSIGLMVMLAYCLINYGHDIQILTLIIGSITGLIGGLFGFYFSSTHKDKNDLEQLNQNENDK